MFTGRFRRITASMAVLASVALVAAGCGDDEDEASDSKDTKTTTSEAADSEMATEDGKTIVVLAQETAELSTLVKAVTAAGLVETLDGTTKYTVFAPTDEAFAAVPKATLDSLLAPAGKQQLVDVLTYHVVEGAVMAGDLTDGQMVTTVNGAQLKVTIGEDGTVMIGDAKVVKTDVTASNGVVHVIDKVLLPPADAADAGTMDE